MQGESMEPKNSLRSELTTLIILILAKSHDKTQNSLHLCGVYHAEGLFFKCMGFTHFKVQLPPVKSTYSFWYRLEKLV